MSDIAAAFLEAMEETTAPGGAVGVLSAEGDMAVAPYGVVHTGTRYPVLPHTLFQIGSITKLYTAVMVMRLVQDGTLNLDTPITDYFPAESFTNPDYAREIRISTLLSHQAGLESDLFFETGRGDDCLERYVARLGDVEHLSRPGAFFSYCNTAFMLLGRVIELVTDSIWDDALGALICAPLGLHETHTLPEAVLLHSAAVGHVRHDGGTVPVTRWMLPRGIGPTGLITASPTDVLRFAAGTFFEDSGFLSDSLRDLMCQFVVTTPDTTGPVGWGLGFALWEADGSVCGHDGSTIGQFGSLRIDRENHTAVMVSTNGVGGSSAMRAALNAWRPGIDSQPHAPAPGLTPSPMRPGIYQRQAVTVRVYETDEGLVLQRHHGSGWLMPASSEPAVMTDLGDGRYSVYSGETGGTDLVRCLTDDSSGRSVLYIGARAHWSADAAV